ncbi:hypothetical protein Taro_015106 [Colocasia esculenta]|uniref:Uncharacterized protein n=1 Tax=Colocasia esculenta TaxID=4460 RepID=A0A843UAP8_COLES|nr:hypothetical protein [Colocasia esculenta]
MGSGGPSSILICHYIVLSIFALDMWLQNARDLANQEAKILVPPAVTYRNPKMVPFLRRGQLPKCGGHCVLVCSVLGEFPTETVTREAHPYPPQVWARRTFRYHRLVRSRVAVVLASTSSSVVSFFSCTSLPRGVFLCVFTDVCMISLARLRPVRGRQTRIKFVSGLTGLNEAFRHSWYQSKVRKFEMDDRRDWGGGGEDPEESTHHMIERIWESLTDIRVRMEQQALVLPAAVPPVDEVSVAPVAPPPRVEVPYVAPVPPPVMAIEELVMQVEKFLRL